MEFRLSARDRAFLRELSRFGYLYVATAEALRSAYERASYTAARVRMQVDRTDFAAAAAEAVRLNDAAWIQSIVVARLISEFIAALEDFGALLHAVRKRGRRGVMVEYLESLTRPVADLFEMVLTRPEMGLSDLLKLPQLHQLDLTGKPEAEAGLVHDYEVLPKSVLSMAKMYRDGGPEGVALEPGTVPSDRIAVVLGEAFSWEEGAKALLVQVHNKIKHRFAVFDDVEALGRTEGGKLLIAFNGRDPAAVGLLVYNITQVSLVTAEVAALLLSLDGIVIKRPSPVSKLEAPSADDG